MVRKLFCQFTSYSVPRICIHPVGVREVGLGVCKDQVCLLRWCISVLLPPLQDKVLPSFQEHCSATGNLPGYTSLRLSDVKDCNGVVLNFFVQSVRPSGLRNDVHITPSQTSINKTFVLVVPSTEFSWSSTRVVRNQQLVTETHPPIVNLWSVDTFCILL